MLLALRKPAYLFVSCVLGLLMFFILQRIVVFFYLVFITAVEIDFSYYSFLIWDYVSLFLSLIAGVFYGFWLGKYWYNSVYHEKAHGGLRNVITEFLFPSQDRQVINFEHKLNHVARELEEGLHDLEKLAENIPAIKKPKKAVKRVVKKKNTGTKSAAVMRALKTVKARTARAKKA